MSWTAIAEADVQTRMTDTELAKYNSIGLASGQTASGVLTSVISDVTELVRGYIKGCPRNGIDSVSGTLPTVLHSPALDIIIVEVMKRVGGAVTDVSDVRIAAYNSAMQFMEKVSDCRFGIPKPTTESTEAYFDDKGGYGYDQQIAIATGKEIVNGTAQDKYTEL